MCEQSLAMPTKIQPKSARRVKRIDAWKIAGEFIGFWEDGSDIKRMQMTAPIIGSVCGRPCSRLWLRASQRLTRS